MKIRYNNLEEDNYESYHKNTDSDLTIIILNNNLVLYVIMLIVIDDENEWLKMTWKGCEPQAAAEEGRFRHVREDGRRDPSLQGMYGDDEDDDDEDGRWDPPLMWMVMIIMIHSW